MRSKIDKAKSVKIISKIVEEKLKNKSKSNVTGFLSVSSSLAAVPLLYEETNATNESKNIEKDGEIQDPIGLHITRLLNEGAFDKVTKSRKKDEKEQQSSIFPLFSSSNVTRVKNCLNYTWTMMHLLFGQSGSLQTEGDYTANPNPTWTQSICTAFGILIFVVIPTMSIGIAMIICTVIKFYLFLLISIVMLFIDSRDLYNAMPRLVQKVIDTNIEFLQEMDRKLLFADLLKGRAQWNEEEEDRSLVERTAPEALCYARSADLDGQSDALSIEKSFQNVDWRRIPNALASTNKEHGGLHSKTVDHLVAINFAYAMMHGDHKSLLKKSNKKNKKKLASTGKSERASIEANMHGIDVRISDSGIGGDDVVVTNLSDFVVESRLKTKEFKEGIEMVKSTPMRPLRRQKSIQKRASMMSYDEADNIDDFVAVVRPRIQSETDLDFYASGTSDENSLDNVSIDAKDDKNKKWLDVGARIGMRLLKSEHVQDLIAQNQLTTNTSSTDNPLEFEDDLQVAGSMDIRHSESPTSQIPKPFHTMWQSQGFDNTSESYILSDLDSESVHADFNRQFVSLSPPGSPISRRKTLSQSVSPMKRMRSVPISKGSSVPSTPKRASSTSDIHNLFALKEIEGDISVTSSESIHLVPKEFDANRHLPAAMAINRGVISENAPIAGHFFQTKDLKMKLSDPLRIKGDRMREPLLPGVKMIVPLFPLYSSKTTSNSVERRALLLATVLSSERVALNPYNVDSKHTDALSITVLLDKSFLRNGKFAKMTLRIPDMQRYFPRHSKYPIGAAVATSFGIGVLVGWRSRDDCHILRSLWQKRGQGSSHAYLNRSAIHGVMEAAVGFTVDCTVGSGKVVAYINGGKKLLSGRYLVQVKKNGRNDNELTSMERSNIVNCSAVKFIPVIEQLKEAAKYRMQVDNYEAERFQMMLQDETLLIDRTWKVFSEGFELFLSSFVKAAEEDENFDSEINNFLSQTIAFLEDFELGGTKRRLQKSFRSNPELTDNGLLTDDMSSIVEESCKELDDSMTSDVRSDVSYSSGLSFIRDLFGDAMKKHVNVDEMEDGEKKLPVQTISGFGKESYNKVYAVLRTLMRTISIAKARCTSKPNLKMALAIIHEMLLFVHNVIKVQQVNKTQASVLDWKESLDEFATIFGPSHARLQKIGNGILQRIENHGKVAKLRALAFAELLVGDDKLLESLEVGDGNDCIARIENAAVSAEIINEDMRAQYHKLAILLYNGLAPRAIQGSGAALRNGKKFTFIAKSLKLLATPARSALSLLTNDEFLDIIERVLVRVFEREQDASQIINIYSWSFRTFRHLRILNNIAIVGNLWALVLDAADEEFSWAVSRTPTSTQEYIKPVSKLFSLGVARFHELHKCDSSVSADWLDFLKENEAIKMIQELDGALLTFLKTFCCDVKEMTYILPYYSSIDDDILNVIDEVDLQRELQEIAEALAEPINFPAYVRDKSAKAVSSFLDYLPKISIPIEKREVGEGWVLTCRGRNGNDLTLSNVGFEQDNLLCKVLGSHNVLGLEEVDLVPKQSMDSLMKDSALSSDKDGNIEISILDHVAQLIRNAQKHGCWDINVGSVNFPQSTTLSASSLDGLPLSQVLRCGINLWLNLQIDDDELLEIAIREISHQIQMQKVNEDDSHGTGDSDWPEESGRICEMNQTYMKKGVSFDVDLCNAISIESNATGSGRRFDPRKDPTVLFLGMNQLTCCLDDFTYRLETATSNSIFDPVFEGVGTLAIKNASIKIRIECRKERINKLGKEVTVPILQLQELDIGLEEVKFQFKETGVDWVLNKIVGNFSDKITQAVRENLQEQVSLTIGNTLESLNKYIEVNPDLMLKILGITIDDLEENVAWV